MARFAEGYQVVRCVSSGFAAFYVVDVQNAFAFAMLANVPVAEEYVFADVPEVELLAFLVPCAGNVRVFDFLHVERRYFDDDV